MSTDARMPTKSATLPIEIAVARSCLREVARCDLRDGVEDERLACRDDELPDQLDGERGRRDDANGRAHTGEHRAEGQRLPEPRVEPAAHRQREHDVDEREDRREVAHRADVDVQHLRRIGVDGGEAQPEQLRARGEKRVDREDRPAGGGCGGDARRSCVQPRVHPVQAMVQAAVLRVHRLVDLPGIARSARMCAVTRTRAATSASSSLPSDIAAKNAAPRRFAYIGSATRSMRRFRMSAWIWHHRSDSAPPPRMRSTGMGRLMNRSTASSNHRALNATPSSTARTRCGAFGRHRDVEERGAERAILDRAALAVEPRREEHASGSRWRRRGKRGELRVAGVAHHPPPRRSLRATTPDTRPRSRDCWPPDTSPRARREPTRSGGTRRCA